MRAAWCLILPGDEAALTPTERLVQGEAVLRVHRASGAARRLARDLLAGLAVTGLIELPRSTTGAPVWPAGFVGSLAHDDEMAVAVVAPRNLVAGVGIDVEPALPLPAELLPVTATASEQAQLNGDLLAARQLFVMEEAVFKASFPLDGVFLEPHDVEICLHTGMARTHHGRVLRVHTYRGRHLLARTMLLAGRSGGVRGRGCPP